MVYRGTTTNLKTLSDQFSLIEISPNNLKRIQSCRRKILFFICISTDNFEIILFSTDNNLRRIYKNNFEIVNCVLNIFLSFLYSGGRDLKKSNL